MMRGAGNSRFEPANSTDFFPTPPWGTRALIEHVLKPLGLFDPLHEVWEPACGEGHMLTVLDEYYDDRRVYAGDIVDRGCGPQSQIRFGDFLKNWFRYDVDWVITNPPFNQLMPFFDCAVRASRRGVAFLAPLTVLEGVDRYKKIYTKYEGRYCVAPFVERLPIVKNMVRKDATTARAYAWLVISLDREVPPLMHIPPCRKELERDSDYD